MAVENKVVVRLMNKNAQENKSHIDAVKEIEKRGWRETYDKVEALLNPTDTTAILRFWQVGDLLLKVYNDSGQNQKIVNQMIALFGKTKGVHDRSLNAAFRFAREFTEDEATELGERYNERQNYRLNQTHIQRVMVGYLDKKLRMEYLKRAVDSAISPDSLAALIKAEQGQMKQGGPRFAEPNTPDALLAQINEVFGKIIKRSQFLWYREQNPAIRILGEDLSFVTETTRTELSKAIDNIAEVIKISERMEQYLRSLDDPYLKAILNRSEQVTERPGTVKSDADLGKVEVSFVE